MIDFHCHIVFDVDDGAKTMEDSIKMIIEAKKAGFTKLIATPHYMEESFEVPKSEINKKITLLNKALEQNNIGVKIYQANEVYITNNIINLIKDNEATTINESKYVLFETPMISEPLNLTEVIYKMLENGITPIVAHPERYTYIQKNPNKLIELIEDGVLFQANYGSIIGQYGKEAKETVIKLLQNNMIHFLGTDTHRPNSVYTRVGEALEELKKILPKIKIDEITFLNAEKVLNNEEIEIDNPTEIKESSFLKKLFK